MTEKETTPLYEKRGRKYVPVAARWYEERDTDQMLVGTFRLVYAYADGGRRYENEFRQDAERYRKLRDKGAALGLREIFNLMPSEWDEAIDAAALEDTAAGTA